MANDDFRDRPDRQRPGARLPGDRPGDTPSAGTPPYPGAPRDNWLPRYERFPLGWNTHPRKAMLMTPALILFGGIFAFLLPTFVAAFLQMIAFSPPPSADWAPLTASAYHGRQIFVANGCVYCHSGFTRPQDVRVGLLYLYDRISLPGDFVTTDDSPNVFGTARIGPDLSREGGFHPDDWHRAHYNDARFVEPMSIMPRFNFLSDQEVDDLIAYVQLRSGKSGLIRYAGQVYAKRVLKAVLNIPDPPLGFQGAKLTLADVAKAALNAPSSPSGGAGGLDWPDPVNLFITDRSYWLAGDPLPVTDNNLLRGRVIFQQRCIGCHGQGGAAVSLAARFLQPTPIDFTSSDDAQNGNDTSPGALYYRILRGIPGSAMENFGTRLRVDDIWRVVLFLKTIPNGSLKEGRVPTTDMYIQWQPPDTMLNFVKQFPIEYNKDFTTAATSTTMAGGGSTSTSGGSTTTSGSTTSTGGTTTTGGSSTTGTTLPGTTTNTGPTGPSGTSTDPWELEAERVFAGLAPGDSIDIPGFGPLSLKTARDGIKAIYDELLDMAWRDYLLRTPTPDVPAEQKNLPPDLVEQLR